MEAKFKHKEIELTQVGEIVEVSLHEPEKISCSIFDNSENENRRSFATIDFRVGRERIVIFLNKDSAKMLSEKAHKVDKFFDTIEQKEIHNQITGEQIEDENGRSEQV